LRKIFILFLIISFFLSIVEPACAQPLMAQYLCELGINFYNQGRVFEALHEFRKALIINPGYEPALKYINIIQGQVATPSPAAPPPVAKPPVEKPPVLKPEIETRQEAIQKMLDRIEKKISPPPVAVITPPVEIPGEEEEKIAPPEILLLNKDTVEALKFPLEVEQGKSIIIRGQNIKRFLVTQPNVLTVERVNQDEVSVVGKEVGYTYLHTWDENGRWTLEFLTIFPRPKGPTLEEELRLEAEKAANFKLRYMLDWHSYEQGRRLHSLNRQSYGYNHWLGLEGPTPYGNLDAAIQVQSLRDSTDLTYATIGLTDGHFGQFEDFNLRLLDYSPNVYNLAMLQTTLRGLMVESPAFNHKITYTAFVGREGGGRYGGLSPGLPETKESYLVGFDVDYFPKENFTYGASVFRGWGDDRWKNSHLNVWGYDLYADWNLDKWDLRYEIAHDSERISQLLNATYSVPKFKLSTEFRNSDRDFVTLNGWGWRIGEIGVLLNADYRPIDKLQISGHLDIFRDRQFPSEDNPHRWNENFDTSIYYTVNSETSLKLDYSLHNELGRISQFRSHNQGIGIYKTFNWFRRFHTYLNYRHQESKNFTSPTLNYINEKVSLGLRFLLIGDIYYYFNKEFNWLEERYTAQHSRPQAMETGLDYYSQISDTPFWTNLRFLYRDEENSVSGLSFLSGEDYIEGYSELAYRPHPDTEIYGTARIKNIWADNPNVNKRIEADFYIGVRYLWDTGFRWEAVGTVDGYVFKDLNSDGLRQAEEEPVEGVKLWLGKKKYRVTDSSGYFEFPKVKAADVYITLDTNTIPSGYVPTVPVSQQAEIIQGSKTTLYFGIASRSEIYGIVFNDIDGNGKLGQGETGIRGVILTLEDGSQATTDDSGRYFFRKVSTGEHVVTLQMNSLPFKYLPTVPIYKSVSLSEGISYVYNIPLKQVKH